MFNEAEERGLMERIAGGDRGAFERLYVLYARAVGHFLFRLCYDESLAEDCLQETFLRLWRAAPQWRGKCKVSTYIYQVAKNVGLDARAKRLREQARGGTQTDSTGATSPHETADTGRGPALQAEGAELRTLVRRAVEALPEEQRIVLELVQTQGLTYREAGEILQLPVGTVKSRMATAAETLRRRLERHLT
jgi:RNA polymerase sigma-70 factor (ECF subfamily)